MKTFNIALDELKTGAIKLVNECQLPPAIVSMVFKDIAEKCEIIAKSQLDRERTEEAKNLCTDSDTNK